MAHLAMQEALVRAENLGATEQVQLAARRAAVVSAARAIASRLFPGHTTAIEALAQRHLAAIADDNVKARAIEFGMMAAEQIHSERQQDGWAELMQRYPPAGPPPDGSETAAMALARGGRPPPSPWLQATPFRLKTAQQFQAKELREFTRSGEVIPNTHLQHSKLFREVDAEAALASRENWHSLRPVMVWNRIARQLGAVCGLDLAGQARVLAALNVALADAMLSASHWRHTIGSWRAIMTVGWNGAVLARSSDEAMLPPFELSQLEYRRVLIPPLPNYPSLRATLAGAAQSALRSFFNTDEIVFTLPILVRPPDGSSGERTFTSISAVARECAFVASLDGGEMREACVAGYSLGTSIGGYDNGKRGFIRR
jgi:hypothetical protein